jgi:hypothetical protein
VDGNGCWWLKELGNRRFQRPHYGEPTDGSGDGVVSSCGWQWLLVAEGVRKPTISAARRNRSLVAKFEKARKIGTQLGARLELRF